MAVVCYELTMEEQLITLFEERYTVQRISMVMDDRWDYDYGIVAKIQKPLETTSTQRVSYIQISKQKYNIKD